LADPLSHVICAFLNIRRAIALVLVGAAAFVAWRIRTWIRISQTCSTAGGTDLVEDNRRFYDLLWTGARLISPRKFNTWPVVSRFLPDSPARLEVGPGLRPRLPLERTQFLDLSATAVAKLRSAGGLAQVGTAAALPFVDGAFDLVCALDVVEHTEDDEVAMDELARVLKPGGHLLLSVPLHPSGWTSFDDFVGHGRRYVPEELAGKLARRRLAVRSSAIYGMMPRFPKLVDFGMRCLIHRRERATWYYTHFFMPIGLWFQSRLRFSSGLISSPKVDEVLLICRKNGE
jgi:SAM-dependent methyltransferase